MTLRDRILQALSEGSSTVQQLAADLGETVADVKAEIRKIKDAWPPQIRVVGTWGELCRKTGEDPGWLRPQSEVYGTFGAPYISQRQRDAVASRYTPPQEPLRRDPFEHMRLAMLARGQQFTAPRQVVTCNTPIEERP